MPSPAWPIPADVAWVEVNGYPMAWQEQGAGTPLVLVHGSFSDYRVWPLQIPAFVRQHRVINVSLRHYYPEIWDGAGGNFSIVQHAEDLGTFVRKLGLGKVHLLGHSRGGAVVLEAAKRHPDLLQSLILVDPAARLEIADAEGTPEALAFRVTLFAGLREAVANGDAEGGAARFFDTVVGAGAWARFSPERRRGFLQNIETALAGDPIPLTTDADLRGIGVPVLTVTGEKSPPIYGFLFAEMHRRAAFPEPVVIPGAGHAMTIDNARAFNDAVLKFTAAH